MAIRSTIPGPVFGINAEGKSLESVTKPLTSTEAVPETPPAVKPA